ncbi:MAG: redoxin family protein [Akkermansiaceae bacterium]|nr:redoxin family protein [Akkermansiaceae bacterium]
MKTSLLIPVVSGLLSVSAFAGFETWTSKDGKAAELELVSVSESGGEKTGEFKMKNGKTVSIKASALSEADAQRLADWKPAEAPAGEAAAATTTSVFDKAFEGNLVKLDGKSLKRHGDPVRPEKYYLFYYTASWCGPCHKFTPSLVKFYNEYRPKTNDFEVVLITSDSDEGAMEDYAAEFKMQWPQLKLSRADRFKKEFKHPGTGIPNLVLTDTEGKLIKTSYVDGKYMGPASVMNHLESLLK